MLRKISLAAVMIAVLMSWMTGLGKEQGWAPPSAEASGTPAEVSAGASHTCALTTANVVTCWGDNDEGQLGNGTTGTQTTPVTVSGLANDIVSVTAGLRHTCALTAGGGVKCWGWNAFGQLGNGTTTDQLTPVNVSGLTSGVASVSAGANHTCALLTTGGAKCWGYNLYGTVGDGTTTNRLTPVDVTGLTSGVGAIAAGSLHTCAVTAGGAVKCWGWNAYGQVGDGTTTDRHSPADVSGLASGVTSVEPGGTHTCALTTGGGVKCWGRNQYGQVGDGTNTNRLTPVDVSGLTNGVSVVTTGDSHSCGIDSGAVVCWGANTYGQLGDTTTTNSNAPVGVLSSNQPGPAVAVAAGDFHTCQVRVTTELTCWGLNDQGQLGNGTFANRSIMGHVLLTGGVDGGGLHTCNLTFSGGMKCWGVNFYGELGDGTTTDHATPADVSGLTSGAAAVSVGVSHSCVVTTAGGAKCWGLNGSGQVGDGTTTSRSAPVDVSGLTTGVAAIAAGNSHTCALTNLGGVKCWGFNTYGQLGNGTTTSSTTPVDVSGLTSGVAAISAGGDHTCAIISGVTKCWGLNTDGQLGDGTVIGKTTPVDVSGLSAAAAVSAGYHHTCALTTAGLARCWGENADGQLGDGTTTDSSAPVNVSGGFFYTAIAANGSHTCSLRSPVFASCWGLNDLGQLGDGTTTNRSTPVLACASGTWNGSTCSGSVLYGTSISVSNSAGPTMAHSCSTHATGEVRCWGSNIGAQLGDGTTTDRSSPVSVVGKGAKPCPDFDGDAICNSIDVEADGDGCPNANEQQVTVGSETSGGLRNYLDPNDYYDVLGPGSSLTHDGVIDLANDILGVILHYAPTGSSPYDVRFDRGPITGANHWNRSGPDGVIDLPNDILGVILQFGHNC